MNTMQTLLKHSDALTEQAIAELCPAPFDQEVLYQRSLAKFRGDQTVPPTKKIRQLPALRLMGTAACLLLTLGLVTGVWSKLRRIATAPPVDPTESVITETTIPTEEGNTQPAPSEGEAPTEAPAVYPTDPQPSAESTTDPTEPASSAPDPTEAAVDPTSPQQERPTEKHPAPTGNPKPTEGVTIPPTVAPTLPPEPTECQPTEGSPTDVPLDPPTECPTEARIECPTESATYTTPQPVQITQLAGFTITEYSNGYLEISDASGRTSPDGMIAYEVSGSFGSGDDDPSSHIQQLSFHVKHCDQYTVIYEGYINGNIQYELWQKRRETFGQAFNAGGWCEQVSDHAIWVYHFWDNKVYARTLCWYDDDYCFKVTCCGEGEQPLLEELMQRLHQNHHGDRLVS